MISRFKKKKDISKQKELCRPRSVPDEGSLRSVPARVDATLDTEISILLFHCDKNLRRLFTSGSDAQYFVTSNVLVRNIFYCI